MHLVGFYDIVFPACSHSVKCSIGMQLTFCHKVPDKAAARCLGHEV